MHPKINFDVTEMQAPRSELTTTPNTTLTPTTKPNKACMQVTGPWWILMPIPKHDICFIKEKTRLIRHSLPFKSIPALMLVRMVLYTVQFVNSFQRKEGLKHYSSSAVMTGAQLHMSQLQLKFGSHCQVAEDVTPSNSLAACTRGAISMGPSGNLSGGQCFLALDTGKLIDRNCWKELPMPLDVIDWVNVLGCAKNFLLMFTGRLGLVIGITHPMLVKLVMVMTMNLL